MPKLFAAIEHGVVLTPDGVRISVPTEWTSFLLKDVSEQFVIKPADGVYARGLAPYTHVGDR